MILVCWALTAWYSLRTFHPFTPIGAVPVSGHDFIEEQPYLEDAEWADLLGQWEAIDSGRVTLARPPRRLVMPLRCERCGSVSIGWVVA